MPTSAPPLRNHLGAKVIGARAPQPAPFHLPAYLVAKAEPSLTAVDADYFAYLASTIEASRADLEDRLAGIRKASPGMGQEAWERDMEIHRLGTRLRTLRRYGLDLCLGRMVDAQGGVAHIGRIGLSGGTGGRLLIDWRSPTAEPFFGATHADPMGLASRRRYRWTDGRITDYWDEVFTPGSLAGTASLDDQSAFIASLSSSRTARMRDVLGTIQADQDAIIRAGSQGALVVDGGPGTGKTVVALHRTAYLLYSDPRLGHQRGGVLFIGPHRPYLDYVSDVLPSLGEGGVQAAVLADLVPEGQAAPVEPDPEVARLKSTMEMVQGIETAVATYEQLPTGRTVIETPWGKAMLTHRDWQETFNAVDPGTAHNDALDGIRESVLGILADQLEGQLEDHDGDDNGYRDADGGPVAWDTGWDTGWDETEDSFDAYGGGGAPDAGAIRRWLDASRGIDGVLERVWPLIEPADLVGDLWTVSDLPLVDAARRRLGDPAAPRVRRRLALAAAAERARMGEVVSQLIATDDSEMHVMSMLRGQDLRAALADDGTSTAGPDPLAGPFAHVVVDEAQELTDAQWQMVLARCPSRSLTIVGDRAQARHGFTESWGCRLARVGIDRVTLAPLSINYRTPAGIMEAVELEIRDAIPGANVPTSIRTDGMPVRRGTTAELGPLLDRWLEDAGDGGACVVTAPGKPLPNLPGDPRIRGLTPELVKGLEFDLVVLVDPAGFGEGAKGCVDRYVSMTRATQELVILTTS